jgi:hypothetical protein
LNTGLPSICLHCTYPTRPEPKAHSLFKTTTHSERCHAGRLPSARRKKLSQNNFLNKNRTQIWKRPLLHHMLCQR